MMNLVDMLIKPREMQSSVAPIEHQIFAENHEDDLNQEHRA
jgi:hypothetical protein